ncbi:MAG: DUF4202 family protein [Phycisphaera sp.]|nr:DUF4202 family protein [Phycisphaera sp.]
MTDLAERFHHAIERIDAANAEDPHAVVINGESRPACLVYGRRMSATLVCYAPNASEALRLAARAQHIRRWQIPRDTYPRDRKGYHLWRTELYAFHADQAEAILRDVGYDDDTIARVRDLLMKKRIKADADMQTLEDVICLVFLEHYFDDFAADHDDDKVVTILRRTWNKMSDTGHDAAMKLRLSERAIRLVQRALSEQ